MDDDELDDWLLELDELLDEEELEEELLEEEPELELEELFSTACRRPIPARPRSCTAPRPRALRCGFPSAGQ